MKEFMDKDFLLETETARHLFHDYAEHMPLVGLYWDSLTYGSSAKLDNMTVDNNFGLNNANNWLSLTVK